MGVNCNNLYKDKRFTFINKSFGERIGKSHSLVVKSVKFAELIIIDELKVISFHLLFSMRPDNSATFRVHLFLSWLHHHRLVDPTTFSLNHPCDVCTSCSYRSRGSRWGGQREYRVWPPGWFLWHLSSCWNRSGDSSDPDSRSGPISSSRKTPNTVWDRYYWYPSLNFTVLNWVLQTATFLLPLTASVEWTDFSGEVLCYCISHARPANNLERCRHIALDRKFIIIIFIIIIIIVIIYYTLVPGYLHNLLWNVL